MKYKVVSDYNLINKKEWLKFVNDNAKGNIFQTPEICKVYKKTYNYKPIFLAVINENKKIIGILLALIQKEHIGFLGIFSARSIIIGGPLIKDNDLEILNFILREYNKIIKKRVIYSQFRNMWEWTEKEKNIFNQNGFDYEEHLNILVDLNKNSDELWTDLKKARKEGIRKAKRNNLVFEISSSNDDLLTFYNLLKITYSKIKLPYPDFDFFKNLLQVLPPENIKLFTLKNEERVIIALIGLIHGGCLSAFYIGIDKDEKILKTRPVDLFYWEVIKWGSNNDCTMYDWMGAGKPNVEYGVRKFKLQFGGSLVEFGRFEKSHKPLLLSVAKIGLKIYKLIK